mgnify:CR=1 FL=1
MFIALLISALSLSSAQAGGYSDVPKDHWAGPAIDRLVQAGFLPPGQGKPFHGNQPVTRYEFAVVMDKFIQDIRRSFIRQPKPKEINEKKIKGRTADGSQQAMIRLAREGFLPYYSPIFHGPEDTLTPERLASALSQVAIRISELMGYASPPQSP